MAGAGRGSNGEPGAADVGALPADSLAGVARAIVASEATAEKVALAKAGAKAWFQGRLSLGHRSVVLPMPDRPGRPPLPELRAPRDMPRRTTSGVKGRIALLHALAHIELNAVDMTWDLVGRFARADVPRAFFDNWVQVGLEEAKHFDLLERRLAALGSFYGAHPAHDGLWQTAQATAESLLARVAIVPLVLEARGLDVTPSMIENLTAAGDPESAEVIGIIYRDEKRHVAFGVKWFRYLAEREGRPPEPTFHALVRQYFKGSIKPPFNERARSEAGLTPGFYKPLSALGSPR
ncbi:MAG TPA: ferritin-like domain-containing protein [Hyphomicrobiaceae bacterium]|nr:ferritin-like domain-containing protein [Hyphomicrobiaceae bacterium]